jgi:hypothetical protein
MKKYIVGALFAISLVIVLLFRFDHVKKESGLLVLNLDKTLLFFVREKNYNESLLKVLPERKNLDGFQFIWTPQNDNQLLAKQFHVFTSKPGIQYDQSVRNYYISHCKVEYSYTESFFQIITNMKDMKIFSIEVADRPFLTFKYHLKKLNYIYIKEIK